MSDSAKLGICQANLEQLELERIEIGWMRMNSPPVVRTQVIHRRGGGFLVCERGK